MPRRLFNFLSRIPTSNLTPCLQARGIEADVVTCCSLINALERGGQWQLAEKLFLQMCTVQVGGWVGGWEAAVAQRLCRHMCAVQAGGW
jgi:pentatricopeptide repeat protein